MSAEEDKSLARTTVRGNQSTGSSADADTAYTAYDAGPDREGLSRRYGVDFTRDGQAETVQRLESSFGPERVHRWADEGMTVDTMGKPRDMAAFRERQEARSDAIPDDIERRTQASVHRNTGQESRSGQAGDTRAPDAVRSVISSPGQSLDSDVQREMEGKMGAPMDHVRIHTGPAAASAADSIDARAFTVGNHVAFNEGEYSPDTDQGQEVLAHELTHVHQQTGGAVSLLPKEAAATADGRSAQHAAPSPEGRGSSEIRRGTLMHVQPKLEVGSPDSPAEREADRVAEAVVSMDDSGAGSPPGSQDAGREGASGVGSPSLVDRIARSGIDVHRARQAGAGGATGLSSVEDARAQLQERGVSPTGFNLGTSLVVAADDSVLEFDTDSFVITVYDRDELGDPGVDIVMSLSTAQEYAGAYEAMIDNAPSSVVDSFPVDPATVQVEGTSTSVERASVNRADIENAEQNEVSMPQKRMGAVPDWLQYLISLSKEYDNVSRAICYLSYLVGWIVPQAMPLALILGYHRAAIETGTYQAIGITGGVASGISGGIGGGIVFGPNGAVGLYGSISGGGTSSLSADVNVQHTTVYAGDSFGGTVMHCDVAVEVGPSVGAGVLFQFEDGELGGPVGVTMRVGIGVSITVVEVSGEFEGTATTY